MKPIRSGSFFNARIAVLGLILLLGVALRLALQNGLLFDQSVAISETAWGISTAIDSSGDAGQVLQVLGQTPNQDKLVSAATGLSYLLFGVNDVSGLAVPILSSALIIILLYLLGSHFKNPGAGLLAGFLWAILPIAVFLSTNLLSIMILLSLNLLTLYVFLRAEDGSSRVFYLVFLVLLLVGLISDWKISLPTALLCFILFLSKEDNGQFRKLGRMALLASPLLFLQLTAFSDALDLYYATLLLLENLILLPLIFICLVYAASRLNEKGVRIILLWLGTAALFTVFAAPWLKADELFSIVGAGAVWLQILIPALVLIAWQFTDRVGEKPTLATIAVLSVVLLLVLTPFVFQNSNGVDTFSRISLGLAYVCLWIYLLSLSWVNQIKRVMFFLFLLFAAFGNLIISKSYAASYSYLAADPRQVIAFLDSIEDQVNLTVGDEALYARFLYLNKYQDTRTLDQFDLSLSMLDPSDAQDVSSNSYVLISENFKDFVLGFVPTNWKLVQEFGETDQQKLLLYFVQ